jgi:hypothetical protein
MSSDYTENTVALNAVTITTTSNPIDISQRNNVSIQLLCSGHTSGNGVFKVQASNDGVNFTDSIALVDATSTTPTTYVASKTLSANGSAMIYLPQISFRFIKVVCTVTTDGAYSAVVQGN